MRFDIKKAVVKTTQDKPTIYDVYILDASGSMNFQNKFSNAKQGIVENFEASAQIQETNNIPVLCIFSYGNQRTISFGMKDCTKALNSARATGGTALNDAIGNTINAIKSKLKESEKVIFKIFTDGQENSSYEFTYNQIAKLMQNCGKDWTFTFVGTSYDTQMCTNNYKLDKSNTLVHDNTGKGLEKAMERTRSAMQTYSANVAMGKSVITGFYNSKNDK